MIRGTPDCHALWELFQSAVGRTHQFPRETEQWHSFPMPRPLSPQNRRRRRNPKLRQSAAKRLSLRSRLHQRHGGVCQRQVGGKAKAKQETLQFESTTRGRFDKSEPTIVEGEDLDVPTFLGFESQTEAWLCANVANFQHNC